MRIIAAHIAIISIFAGSLGAVATSALCLLSACILIVVSKIQKLNVFILLILFLLLIHGIINTLIGNTSFVLFFTAFSSTTAYFLTFYLVLKSGFSLRYLFSIYIKYAVVVAIFGYIQATCWLIGVEFCYDFSRFFPMDISPARGVFFGIRLNSFLFEPSQVAFTMGPAIAVCLLESILPSRDRITNLPTRLIIVIFALLSQSSAAYMVILFSVIAAVFISGRLIYIVSSFLVVSIIGFIIFSTPEFIEPSLRKARALFQLSQVGEQASEADATTYSIYLNGLLSLKSLISTFFLGAGIGSHEFLYGYLGESGSTPHRFASIGTAANLVFRLTSELGLAGLFLLATVFWKGTKAASKNQGVERLIFLGMLAGVFAFCLRNGAFGAFGLAFYVMVLIFGRRFENEEAQHAHR